MNTRAEFQTRFRELAPIIYYGDIDDNVQLSILRERPGGKVYAYCDAMAAGGLEMIICITDGCIACSYADSPDQAGDWPEKILKAVLALGTRPGWYAKYYLEKKQNNWPMQMGLDERLTSGFIEAYVPSLDEAAYLRSIDHHFSEVEKATIIGNHENLSKKEKIEALQRMQELTEDGVLRERLGQAVRLIRENKYLADDFPAWEALHDFFPIPYDFRHGDIVHFVGNSYHNVLGVILGYDEKAYEFYCNFKGDYSDVQITVDTRFLIEKYDAEGNPVYDYLGEFSHEHVNPIYIERARLAHDNECIWYLRYLAACDTEQEEEWHSLAQKVITKELKKVWQYYPKLSLMELAITAAKVGTLWIKHPQTSVEEMLALPAAEAVDVAKVKDSTVMDGLFYMLPEDV